jgi:hypothetical protein
MQGNLSAPGAVLPARIIAFLSNDVHADQHPNLQVFDQSDMDEDFPMGVLYRQLSQGRTIRRLQKNKQLDEN